MRRKPIRRLKCQSWASDCLYKVGKLFDARHVVKMDARHGIDLFSTMIRPDAMSGIVFDAMSGVKKLVKFIPAINCTTSAVEPSTRNSLDEAELLKSS